MFGPRPAFLLPTAPLSLSSFVPSHTSSPPCPRIALPSRARPRRISHPVAQADTPPPSSDPTSPPPSPPSKPDPSSFFGIRLRTNGDVLKFGAVAIAVPFAFKALLQTFGIPDLLAGQMTTGFVSVFALLAWVSTYVFRVGTKNMTYAQQLRDYENQVIQKRYEELTDEELAALQEELKDDE